jgi:hypothetical protein
MLADQADRDFVLPFSFFFFLSSVLRLLTGGFVFRGVWYGAKGNNSGVI